MKYNVHIYAVVRLKVENIEADTHRDAICSALESVDFYREFEGKRTEYAEDITSYVVDEVGDESYEHTRTYLDADHLELNKLDQEWGVEILAPDSNEEKT